MQVEASGHGDGVQSSKFTSQLMPVNPKNKATFVALFLRLRLVVYTWWTGTVIPIHKISTSGTILAYVSFASV